MLIRDQLLAKTEALRSVQSYCQELRKLRAQGIGTYDEVLEVERYIEQQINGYKQLVKELNEKIK